MKSQASDSRLASSTLLTASSTGLSDRRRIPATCASSSVGPTAPSTTMTTTSASSMARSAWMLTWRASGSSVRSQPPVSTTAKARPIHSASRILRSRVTPDCSSTMASRRPTMRFTSVLLPTLGRPTTATTG